MPMKCFIYSYFKISNCKHSTTRLLSVVKCSKYDSMIHNF